MKGRYGQRCCISLLYAAYERPVPRSELAAELGALGGTRTPNLLIRSQMLYPLSYERSHCSILHCGCSLRVLGRSAHGHSGGRASDSGLSGRFLAQPRRVSSGQVSGVPGITWIPCLPAWPMPGRPATGTM